MTITLHWWFIPTICIIASFGLTLYGLLRDDPFVMFFFALPSWFFTATGWMIGALCK